MMIFEKCRSFIIPGINRNKFEKEEYTNIPINAIIGSIGMGNCNKDNFIFLFFLNI